MLLSIEQLDALAMDAIERFSDAARHAGTNGGLYRFEGVDVYWSRKGKDLVKLHIQGVDYDLPIG